MGDTNICFYCWLKKSSYQLAVFNYYKVSHLFSAKKNKLSRFLHHQTLSLSNYIFTGHLPLHPQLIPKQIVAPVTGDLSLKSRNLSLKAGSLRLNRAEAVSTKMVNFVPQQKHMDPGLKYINTETLHENLQLSEDLFCLAEFDLCQTSLKPQGFDI